MTYEELINKIKTVVDAYTGQLEFKYDRVWAVNGELKTTYPLCLVESQPDFELSGQQQSFRPSKQIFKGKIFFFDTFWMGEQSAKSLQKKQSELNETAMKIIAEVSKYFLNQMGVKIVFGSGFFGVDVHNAKLIEVFVPFTVELSAECTLGEFVYA